MNMGGLDNLIANTAYLQAPEVLRRRQQGAAAPAPEPDAARAAELRAAPPGPWPPTSTVFASSSLSAAASSGTSWPRCPRTRRPGAFWRRCRAGSWPKRAPPRAALQGLVTTCAAAPVPGRHPFFSPALVTKCQAATTEDERASLVELAKAEVMASLGPALPGVPGQPLL